MTLLLLCREALLKMREVYTKNPTLGDPATVESQLALIGKKVDALRLELQKYQVSLREVVEQDAEMVFAASKRVTPGCQS